MSEIKDFIVSVSGNGYLSGLEPKFAYIYPWKEEIRSVSIRYLEDRYEYDSDKSLEGINSSKMSMDEYLRLISCNYQMEVSQKEVIRSDGEFGSVGVIDLSDIEKAGQYSIWIGDASYAHFFVRKDSYLRTAYETFYFSHIQRCGCEIPGWHAACHLDDAIRRDNGQYAKATGGWHDAGDLRKWMIATQWQAIGMTWAKIKWDVSWSKFAGDDILDELKWGNLYFHNMQDPDTGLIWSDVGGGIKGNGVDNHWTDNIIGNEDDRHINTENYPDVCFQFAWTQGLIAKVFGKMDKDYAQKCLFLACRAFNASIVKFDNNKMNTFHISLALLAACTLSEVSGKNEYKVKAKELLEMLLSRQENDWIANQNQYKGFFYEDESKNEIFKNIWMSCVLPFSLLVAAESLEKDDSYKADVALKSYLDNYIMPLSKLTAYEVIPWGAVLNPKTTDHYRTLAGDLKFRFFCPVRDECGNIVWMVGNNGHILGHAAALLAAAKRYGNLDYRKLALKQMEWTHGNNPLGESTVSGHGVNAKLPHSKFVGIIPGGVMCGLAGDENDSFYFGQEYRLDYSTMEYWSPIHFMYFMCICELHDDYSLETDIGVR